MMPGRKTVEKRIYATADKRAVDQDTIARVYGGEEPLMEVAGHQIAEYLYQRYDSELEQGTVVLAGVGNNGGDGYVIARWLQAWGYQVLVVAVDPPRTKAAQWARQSWLAAGGTVTQDLPGEDPGLIVDCLYGSGISRPVTSASVAGKLIAWANNRASSVRIAVDMPSGCYEEPEVVLQAHRTFALGCLVPMHVVEPAKSCCGETTLLTLGFEAALAQLDVVFGEYISGGSHGELPALSALEHKAACRPVVVVGGSSGMEGAALLACLGARKAGASYIHWVQLDAGLPASIPDEIEIVRHQVASVTQIQALVERIQGAVWVLGPGQNLSEVAGALLHALLEQLSDSDAALVVDAGALDWLMGLDLPLPVPAVITPHPGEAARLLGCSVSDIQHNRLQQAQAIAQQFGCHVVLKGSDPVLYRSGASPGPQFQVYGYPASALATAGSGDVLAGIVGALVARRRDEPLDMDWMFGSASTAVHIHQMAGAALTERAVAGWNAREIAAEIQDLMRGG